MGNKKKEALTKFNRDNILVAAKNLFETKGINATTVEEIAKEADYSKSTLYVYFKSKDEILHTIIYEHMVLLKEIINTCISKAKSFEESYFNVCNGLVEFQEKYPVYYDVMLGEIKITELDRTEKNVVYDIYEVGEEINDMIEKFLKKGIKSGCIRKDIEIIPTVLYLWSMISETIHFANRKQAYFKLRLGMSKSEYMDYGFRLLLESITK